MNTVRIAAALKADHGFMSATVCDAAIGLAGTKLNPTRMMAESKEELAVRFALKNLTMRPLYPILK